MPGPVYSRSYEYIPLEMFDEEDSFVPSTQLQAVQAEGRLFSLIRRSCTSRRSSYLRTHPSSSLFCRGVLLPFLGLVFTLGILKLVSLSWQGLIYLFPDELDASLDAWAFPSRPRPIFSRWVTHGVIPVACHSHNDYMRDVPLYSALEAGCVGVEVDIWLSNENDLLVGRTPHILMRNQTLNNLYLQPLLEILQRHNTRTADLSRYTDSEENTAGVFTSDPTQTLVLHVDFKTDGERLWPHLVEQLEPLRQAGYLTHVNGSTVVYRPVTIVASGYAPFSRVLEQGDHCDIFYDAPLADLAWEASPYNTQNSYYASTDFRREIGHLTKNRFSQEQLTHIRQQVGKAHQMGFKVRYWGTPTWPRGLRNHVWHVLLREGVDLINTDDLQAATKQDWRKHRSWWS